MAPGCVREVMLSVSDTFWSQHLTVRLRGDIHEGVGFESRQSMILVDVKKLDESLAVILPPLVKAAQQQFSVHFNLLRRSEIEEL